MLRDLNYAFPGAASLLFGFIAILMLSWWLYTYREKVVRRLAEAHCLPAVLQRRSRLLYSLYVAALGIAWVGTVLALMQPQGAGHYQRLNGDHDPEVVEEVLTESTASDDDTPFILRRKAHDIIFLVDASASMSVTDTTQGITRLEYAKEIIDELASSSDGEALALYAFTSEVTPLVPVTQDTLFFRLVVRQVDINEGDVAGTDLAEALETVADKHFRRTEKRRTTLILLTDGGDTRLEQMTGPDREREVDAIASRIGDASAQNLRVFTIGLGTQEGRAVPGVQYDGRPVNSSLDEALLGKLADKGRGHYFFANQHTALSITQQIRAVLDQDNPFIEEVEVTKREGIVERVIESERQVTYDQYFQWPLGFAILALVSALLLPEYRRRKDDA